MRLDFDLTTLPWTLCRADTPTHLIAAIVPGCVHTALLRAGRITNHGGGSFAKELDGPAHTDCFRFTRTPLSESVDRPGGSFSIAIVTEGRVRAENQSGETVEFNRYDRVLIPAG